jgi:hypothetical protein
MKDLNVTKTPKRFRLCNQTSTFRGLSTGNDLETVLDRLKHKKAFLDEVGTVFWFFFYYTKIFYSASCQSWPLGPSHPLYPTSPLEPT